LTRRDLHRKPHHGIAEASRILAASVLAVLSLAARPQGRAEDVVARTLQQLERTEQTGDASAWVALWSRERYPN